MIYILSTVEIDIDIELTKAKIKLIRDKIASEKRKKREKILRIPDMCYLQLKKNKCLFKLKLKLNIMHRACRIPLLNNSTVFYFNMLFYELVHDY